MQLNPAVSEFRPQSEPPNNAWYAPAKRWQYMFWQPCSPGDGSFVNVRGHANALNFTMHQSRVFLNDEGTEYSQEIEEMEKQESEYKVSRLPHRSSSVDHGAQLSALLVRRSSLPSLLEYKFSWKITKEDETTRVDTNEQERGTREEQ